MSYKLREPMLKNCTECDAPMLSTPSRRHFKRDLYNFNQMVCGPACARKRKSRLQKEHRHAQPGYGI